MDASLPRKTEDDDECGNPQIAWMTLAEIRRTYAYNPHRMWLLDGLVKACVELRGNGCRAVFIGGSFVDEKDYPGDYDACFDTVGVSSALDPVLFDPDREVERKDLYRGDWLFGRLDPGPAGRWIRFIAKDRLGRSRKLIGLKLNLKELVEG